MNFPLAQQLTQIGSQRLAMGLTQAEAAGRAGVAYRTWRRMEKDASASIEDLVRAAIALRCEQGMTALFPEPAASSMDELLARQKAAAGMSTSKRPKQARA
jgi:transcriptional regulator with XRE-family HTH domain